jgi:hypothetical protein
MDMKTSIKNEGSMNKLIARAITGAVLMTAPLAASALVIDINTYLAGNPVGNVTVATLTLAQNGNSVDFRFENSVSNLGAIGDDAFISGLLFSYNGSPLLTSSSFGNFGGTQLLVAADIEINPPGTDAGYDFYLDLGYPTSNKNPELRFTDGEYSTWTVSAADRLSAVLVSDFTTLVTANGKPASLAMAHIQQVGAGPEGSGSLEYVGSSEATTPPQEDLGTVPEPATLALLGVGLASMSLVRRRKK